jgi:hypothetical protein
MTVIFFLDSTVKWVTEVTFITLGRAACVSPELTGAGGSPWSHGGYPWSSGAHPRAMEAHPGAMEATL